MRKKIIPDPNPLGKNAPDPGFGTLVLTNLTGGYIAKMQKKSDSGK
jgi:hypothetical protein